MGVAYGTETSAYTGLLILFIHYFKMDKLKLLEPDLSVVSRETLTLWSLGVCLVGWLVGERVLVCSQTCDPHYSAFLVLELHVCATKPSSLWVFSR